MKTRQVYDNIVKQMRDVADPIATFADLEARIANLEKKFNQLIDLLSQKKVI